MSTLSNYSNSSLGWFPKAQADQIILTDMAKQPDSQEEPGAVEDDRQEEADDLKTQAADWDGEKDDLIDITNLIIDLSGDGKATETIKEICYDLRSHPKLPQITWVELTSILARIFIDEDDFDVAEVWADQANDAMDEIEENVQRYFGEGYLKSDSNVSYLREQLDEILCDIAVYNGDCDSEDSEDAEDEEMSD